MRKHEPPLGVIAGNKATSTAKIVGTLLCCASSWLAWRASQCGHLQLHRVLPAP